jgi:hypothetical protein
MKQSDKDGGRGLKDDCSLSKKLIFFIHGITYEHLSAWLCGVQDWRSRQLNGQEIQILC